MFAPRCNILVIQSSSHKDLLVLKGSQLVISNQYIFLWNVLPKYTKQFIHRTKFVKEVPTFL